MTYDLVIKGGTLVTPASVFTADVGVSGELIVAVGADLCGKREIDASGKLVFPGVIDAHTHMALPVAGMRSSDDFHSGTVAAACGGVTTIVDFTVGSADTEIPDDIERRVAEAACAVVDVALHAEVIGWEAGQAKQFRRAIELGVTSFKFYTAYEDSGRRTASATLRRAFEELARLGATALVHCEDDDLIRSLEAHLSCEEVGRMDTLADVRPDLCEQSAIVHVGQLARETSCRTHIVHVSSRLGLRAVEDARAGGSPLSAETCPQYLLLTREVYNGPDGHLFSATPALRTDDDRRALWNGLRTRDVDLVASDHCPFTRAQKAWRGSFRDLPYGLPGVETLLPLLYSEGVEKGILALIDIPRLLCEGPARTHGLYPQKGTLQVGADADVVVFDPHVAWQCTAEGLHMKTDFSPYEGRAVTGRVQTTISRGRVVVDDGQPIDVAERGRFVCRVL